MRNPSTFQLNVRRPRQLMPSHSRAFVSANQHHSPVTIHFITYYYYYYFSWVSRTIYFSPLANARNRSQRCQLKCIKIYLTFFPTQIYEHEPFEYETSESFMRWMAKKLNSLNNREQGTLNNAECGDDWCRVMSESAVSVDDLYSFARQIIILHHIHRREMNPLKMCVCLQAVPNIIWIVRVEI